MKINILLSNKIEFNDAELDKQFVRPICLGGAIFSFIAIFINTQLNFGPVLTVIPYISLVVFSLLYYLAYKGKMLSLVKWVTVFTTLSLVNLIWVFNFGSHSPVLYLFVIIFSYLIFMLDGKQLLLAGIFLIINVAVLYFIEINNPGIVGNYPSRTARVEDVYTGIFLNLFLIFIMMRGAKNIYISQYKKAKKADQLKSSFLANMSHEIRTPLNAIVGFSNILAEEELSAEERKQYVSIINSSNESLLRLVNDILDVSMIESDQLKIETKECDLSKIMTELEETYLLKLKANNIPSIKIVNSSPDESYFVTTDCERLRQVLINLMDNAIKYTEEGFVEIGYEVEKRDLLFYVKDTGIGIKPSHLEYLFDRFYKIEDDNTKLYRGTGIGLYLTKKIANLLGGNIWVDSKFGKGSHFYFTIPKTGYKVGKKDIKTSKEQVNEDVIKMPKEKVKLLIVEDQLSNQEYYRAILSDSPYKIIPAMNGLEGVEAFKQNPDVKLILMDIKMPVMDGFEALKEIRKIDKNVTVIALTAHAMTTDKQLCFNAGFDGYFAKPLNKNQLLKEIARLSNKKE